MPANLQFLMGKESEEETDWYQWLGLEPTEEDKIYSKAKELGIPILDGDSVKDVYGRIQSLRSFNESRRMMFITLASTCIAVVSAAAAVWSLFR